MCHIDRKLMSAYPKRVGGVIPPRHKKNLPYVEKAVPTPVLRGMVAVSCRPIPAPSALRREGDAASSGADTLAK